MKSVILHVRRLITSSASPLLQSRKTIMFDDLAAYYRENVVAAFLEYTKTSKDSMAGRSRDLRLCLVAATALFHLREHLPTSGALTRPSAEQQCSDYALLGDIVNAAKHKSINQRTPHGPPLVADATSLTETLLIIKYEDSKGAYHFTEKSVIATLSDGSQRNLLEVLMNVVNFWEKHLHLLGVLSQARTFVFDPSIRFRTRKECDQIRLDLELVQGHRFKQQLQLLKFDKSTGLASPIDLTGTQMHFRVYKPRIEIEVFLKHEATGQEFSRKLVLSEEESAEFADLTNDEERGVYVSSLSSSLAALKELASEAGSTRTN